MPDRRCGRAVSAAEGLIVRVKAYLMSFLSADFVGENSFFLAFFALRGAHGAPINHTHRPCGRTINHAIGAT